MVESIGISAIQDPFCELRAKAEKVIQCLLDEKNHNHTAVTAEKDAEIVDLKLRLQDKVMDKQIAQSEQSERVYEALEYALRKEIETLKQQLAEFKAVNHGFDRKGKFCNCSWGSGLHGDICPEHGTEGKKIGPDAKIEGLRQKLEDLQDAVRLMVGRSGNKSWREVP